MEFRDAVKYLRKELGLTQIELAAALHVNTVTVGRWENGRTQPTRSITSVLTEFAQRRSASEKCIELLKESIDTVSREKLEHPKNVLYSVEHASLRELIDEASFPFYVCDMETDELLYINGKAKEMTKDVSDGEQAPKCYQYLMQRESPCELCNKNKLPKNHFICHEARRTNKGVTYCVYGKKIKWNGHNAHVHYITEDSTARLLESIIHNMNNGVAASVLHSDGTVDYVFVTDRYYAMLGYTREQYKKEVADPFDLIYRDDVENLRKTAVAMKTVGETQNLRYRAIRRDSSVIWLEVNITIISFADIGEPIQLSVFTDVTQIVEASNQLETQRDRMNEILNTIPSGIAEIEINPKDKKHGLLTTYYNDRFFGFSGYTREEYDKILKKNEMGFVFSEDIPILLEDTQKICKGKIGNSRNSIIRCRTKDKSYRWLLLTGQLVKKRGDICVIRVVMVDITLRKEAEDKLRISEEMLRIAAETDKRILITYDIKANVCHVESRMLYSAKYGEVLENIPDTLVETGIVSPESVNDLCMMFRRIKSGEQAVSASLSLRTGKQEYQWFECNATTVFDSEKQPNRAVLVFHNITEQRVKEAVYMKWKNSILTRNPDTYTLFRSNLSRDSKCDEQDGNLLKIRYSPKKCSFNERTMEYAKQYVFPEDMDAYIALLNADSLLAKFYRGEHTATLEYRETGNNGEPLWRLLTVEMVEYLHSTDIQAFLMYEDIDEKKKAEFREIERVETDPLTGVLNRTAFADKVDAFIRQDESSQHAMLMMDMDGFKQINDNFGHAAGDQALIDTAAILRTMVRNGDLICRFGGDEYLIWMRNVPYDAVIEKTAKQICEQVRKSFGKEVKISASIGISVYSRDGNDFDELYRNADAALYRVKQAGKDNYAFFSTAASASKTVKTEPEPVNIVAPKKIFKARRRMLVVDDNSTSRVLLSNIFKNEYLIETAKNGDEALMRLRHFGTAINIVLLDLLMPGTDGYEVLRKMQSNAELRTIPVVVVSGEDNRKALLKAVECGAADYVSKPIDVELIRLRVKSAVSKAENERLRAQNSYLQLQKDEEVKFHTVLESTGTVVVEYDWHNHVFVYDNSIERYIAGDYNRRSLWQAFLSDMVATSEDVRALQDSLMRLANNREEMSYTTLVMLLTPEKLKHWFSMSIYKQTDAYGLAEKMIITFNDVHEKVLANEKLMFQATRDELTGLYNRNGFIEKATEMIASKEAGYYAMSCIDIEKFKVINDQYGTQKGDAVLRSFAKVLQSLNDGVEVLCCRIMADVFAVLYPSRLILTDALKINHAASEKLDGSLPPLKIYIGRCIVEDKSLDVSAIYDRASIAKETVKGRYDEYVATYDESMRTSLLRQQKITGQMKSALQSGQFEVWLQPQFNHGSGALIGAEALVRWRHPQDGIISPIEFIPIFERNGFVYELDKFVWEQTCRSLRRWIDRGMNPVSVAVNVSRYDVFKEDLIDVITGLVQKYKLPSNLLRLEITESAFSQSADQIIRVVEKLMDLGFIVEIDDFGSGYSSLNTLKDVPAQVLKMDMRFLENESNTGRGSSIIESVVRMAGWLGMSVIAEGVETIEQADYLKSIGCEQVQGYLYSKPIPVPEYEKLYLDTRNSSF